MQPRTNRGIFYANQLSSNTESSSEFNMGKSGSIWLVPEVETTI